MKRKKLLSLLLAAVLCIGLLPLGARAQETPVIFDFAQENSSAPQETPRPLVVAEAGEMWLEGTNTVRYGQSMALTVCFDPADAMEDFTVSVGDPSVIQVSVSGQQIQVVGQQLGVSELTVTSASGLTAKATILVYDPNLPLDQRLTTQFADGNGPTYNFTANASGYYELDLNVDEEACVEVFSGSGDYMGSFIYEPGTKDNLVLYMNYGASYFFHVYLTNSQHTISGTVEIYQSYKYVTAMEILSLPYRTTYVRGFVNLTVEDLYGLTMYVYWADGTVTYYDAEEDGATIGSFGLQAGLDGSTLYLFCCEAEVSYKLTLIDNPVHSIEIANEEELPTLIENGYMAQGVYSSHPILRKLQIQVNYTDGTSEVLNFTDKMMGYNFEIDTAVLNGPDQNNVIQVSLLGRGVVFHPKFAPTNVESLELVSAPKPLDGNTDYRVVSYDGKWAYDHDWGGKLNGMVFKINYTDGTSETLTYNDLTFPNLDALFFDMPEYKDYPVETQLYLPEYGQEFNYWVGAPVIPPNGRVPMILHYQGAYLTFDLPIRLNREGWHEDKGNWYYFRDGLSVTGWIQVEEKWYCFDASGIMLTGWQEIEGKRYYFGDDGVMTEGWRFLDGKWYYFGGAMATDWQRIDGKWYYFNAQGHMMKGWQLIDGKWYYFDTEMKTGWQRIGNKWYYLGTNGVMTTGWQQVGGKWYYMDGNGVMQTAWEKIDGKWYFFSSGGAMQRGWRKINGNWYFLYNDMKTGWVSSSGKWYYLAEDGIMVHSCTLEIDGKTYTFDENGVWVQ